MSTKKSPSGIPAELTGTIAAFDTVSCGAAQVTLQSVPVPGCLPGDSVLVIPSPSIVNLGFLPGRCAVAGTAIIPVVNPTAGAIDPPVQAFQFVIARP